MGVENISFFLTKQVNFKSWGEDLDLYFKLVIGKKNSSVILFLSLQQC